MSLYLDLMEKVILDQVYEGIPTPPDLMPLRAYSALSKERMKNVRECCDDAIISRIPGVFVECGVWRGGAAMMMAAVARDLRVQREVICCDSFEGLPRPGSNDAGLDLFMFKELSIPIETVEDNFRRLGLYSDKTILVKGWFKDTLPWLAKELKSRSEKIAVLRADGDMYESTRNIMDNLYPLIAPRGFFIEDDYYNIVNARRAVDDYRQEHGISIPIQRVDNSGCFWRLPGG